MPRPSDLPPAVIVPDGRTALGLVRSLAPRGVPCTIGAWNELGPACYSRDAEVIRCPAPRAGRAFLDALIAVGRSFTTRPVLFTADETSTLLADCARDELAAHFHLALGSSPQLGALLNKPRLYELCAAAGLSTPATRIVNDGTILAGLSYPLVLKPAQRVIHCGNYQMRSFRLEFGCKAVLVHDASEAQALAARAKKRGFEMLLQHPIEGPVTDLVTAGVFAGSDGTRAGFTARKLAQSPADFGDGSVVEGVPLPEVAELAWRLIDQSGFVGVADIEFKRDSIDGQLKLLDVNPRPWLWIDLARRCGVNLPYLLYREAIARQNNHVPVQHPRVIAWCSARGLLGMARGKGSRRVLGAALRSWSHYPSGDRTLTHMLLHPGFWRDLLRMARGQLVEM